MNLTPEAIEAEYKDGYTRLQQQYGKYAVPKDEVTLLSEIHRAKYACLAAGSSTLDPAIMRQYSIINSVIELLCGQVPDIERRVKNVDRRRAMENWCAENIDAIITPNELAEVGGVSYATAIKFINERVDLFRKIERGRYIVRNLRAEQ